MIDTATMLANPMIVANERTESLGIAVSRMARQDVFERMSFRTPLKSASVIWPRNGMFVSTNGHARSGVVRKKILPSRRAGFQPRTKSVSPSGGRRNFSPDCAVPVLDNAHCPGKIGLCLRNHLQEPLCNPR